MRQCAADHAAMVYDLQAQGWLSAQQLSGFEHMPVEELGTPISEWTTQEM